MKELGVAFAGRQPVCLRYILFRTVIDPVPDQDSVIVGVAHRDSNECVGRRQPPWFFDSIGFTLALRQRTGQAAFSRHVQELAREKPELLRKAIGCHDQFWRTHPALRSFK